MTQTPVFCSKAPKLHRSHVKLRATLYTMGFGRIFSKGGNGGFFHELFSRMKVNSIEISFYYFETKRTTFFSKNLLGNNQISKSREGSSPISDANVANHNEE